MNARDIYKLAKKCNVGCVDLGNVFIDDELYVEDGYSRNELTSRVNVFNHVSQYSNFYFPFNRVSLISQFKEDTVTIVFEDNPQHKLNSPIKFTYISTIGIEIRGYFHMGYKEDFPDDESILALQRLDLSEYVCKGVPAFYQNEIDDVPICVVVHFQNVIMRSGGKSSKRFKFNELDQFGLNGKNLEMFVSVPVSNLMTSIAYFFGFMIDTKLFVVEECVATEKKGKLKVSTSEKSIFRIIDVKSLRKRYMNHNDDNPISKRSGHERRRHTRTFRSDFYKNKKGETIIINACWIGPSESFNPDKNRLYKVRLDIG